MADIETEHVTVVVPLISLKPTHSQVLKTDIIITAYSEEKAYWAHVHFY